MTTADTGKPFINVLLTDNAETLARRCFNQLCTVWSEKEVRAAFQEVLDRPESGRPGRSRLEPTELWLVKVFELWPAREDGRPDKLGFAKRFCRELGGHSVEAARKKLDRLLKLADEKP